MVKYLLARLREPSTWAAFAGLAVVVGLTAEQWQAVATAGAAVAGLIAVLLPDTNAAA